MLTALAVAAAPLTAADLFIDDFECYPNGQLPNTDVGGGVWDVSNSPDDNYVIFNETTQSSFGSPNRYLQMDSDGGSDTIRLQSPALGATSGALTTFSFDFYEPSVPGSGSDNLVVGFGTTDLSSTTNRARISLNNGVIGGFVDGGDTYEVNTAYRMFFVLNDTADNVVYEATTIAAESFAAWIQPLDGGPLQFVGSKTAANASSPNGYFVGFRNFTGNDQELWIDNVTLSEGPNAPAPVEVGGLGRTVFIGDSITEGRATRPDGEGNWSWRYWFWENLVNFSIDHQFVGTRAANHEGSSAYPPYLGETFMNRHESKWGTHTELRAAEAPTYLGTLASAGQKPDTAVIFGGCNDVPLDLSVSATTVRDRFKTIVDRLQGDLGTSGNPAVRILLVSILPRFKGNPRVNPDVRNGRYSEINDLLAALALAEATSTSEVLFLDLEEFFSSPPEFFYDGTHPNGLGEQLIGNAVFAALIPGMPPVQLKIDALNLTTGRVDLEIRTHGPQTVRIQSSPDLSLGSWLDAQPPQLNPGEWMPMQFIESPLPTKRFFRALVE